MGFGIPKKCDKIGLDSDRPYLLQWRTVGHVNSDSEQQRFSDLALKPKTLNITTWLVDVKNGLKSILK